MSAKGHKEYFAADIEWRSGSEGVLHARFQINEDLPTSPTILVTKYLPGAVIPPHTHASDYGEYIIEGELTVGRTVFRAGDVRTAKAGTGYGPLTAGPQGCTVVIVFADTTGMKVESLPRKPAAVA